MYAIFHCSGEQVLNVYPSLPDSNTANQVFQSLMQTYVDGYAKGDRGLNTGVYPTKPRKGSKVEVGTIVVTQFSGGGNNF
jgi:hypothetical protein